MTRTIRKAPQTLQAFDEHDANVRAFAARMLARAAIERADDPATERERAHCARRDNRKDGR
jgi:hypothetical protein